jgi:hypothetical protein
MRIVKIRFPAADLSREMAAMREWLDSNRYEPAKFDCDHDGVDVVLSVQFMLDEAAKAFAKRFGGKDGPRSSVEDSSLRFAT